MKFELRDVNKTYSSKERELNTVRLHVEINTICNNKCAYCYARANKQTWGTMMSSSYINDVFIPNMKKLIKTLRNDKKYLDVVLLGGEPTLYPKFSDVVNFLCDNDVRISITTNGTYPYKNILPSKNIRWAYTFHPTQISDVVSWFNKILSGKDDWWEVAISPLIDCWGNEKEILLNSSRVKFIMLDGVLKGDLKLNKTINKYLDLCLKCDKCSNFCPSAIDVCKIFETAKYEYAQNSFWSKFIFFLESKVVFGNFLKLMKIFFTQKSTTGRNMQIN